MTLQIVAPPDPQRKLLLELRTSLEAAHVTWALAKADFALKGRPEPERITDLHPHERRLYEDRAIAVLMTCNRDAELYALSQASHRANELFEQYVQANGLDWLDPGNPINADDALEVFMASVAAAVVLRYTHLLCGIYPGLSGYLATLEQRRSGR